MELILSTVVFVRQALLERGFSSLMDSQRLSELKLMYQLFQRVQKLDEARLWKRLIILTLLCNATVNATTFMEYWV